MLRKKQFHFLALFLLVFLLVGCSIASEFGATSTLTPRALPTGEPTPIPIPTLEPIQEIQLAGQLGGATYAVAIQGGYAYLGMGPRLLILDISSIENPVLVGQTNPLSDTIKNITVAENYAYLVTGAGGLEIVEISNVENPLETGYLDIDGVALGVSVLGDYAYIAAGDGGLRIVDIRTPESPIEVSVFNQPVLLATGGMKGVWVWDVAVDENYAYLAAGEAGLRIVDISEPEKPIEVVLFNNGTALRDITVAGDFVYGVDGKTGIYTFHVADPKRPTNGQII